MVRTLAVRSGVHPLKPMTHNIDWTPLAWQYGPGTPRRGLDVEPCLSLGVAGSTVHGDVVLVPDVARQWIPGDFALDAHRAAR